MAGPDKLIVGLFKLLGRAGASASDDALKAAGVLGTQFGDDAINAALKSGAAGVAGVSDDVLGAMGKAAAKSGTAITDDILNLGKGLLKGGASVGEVGKAFAKAGLSAKQLGETAISLGISGADDLAKFALESGAKSRSMFFFSGTRSVGEFAKAAGLKGDELVQFAKSVGVGKTAKEIAAFSKGAKLNVVPDGTFNLLKATENTEEFAKAFLKVAGVETLDASILATAKKAAELSVNNAVRFTGEAGKVAGKLAWNPVTKTGLKVGSVGGAVVVGGVAAYNHAVVPAVDWLKALVGIKEEGKKVVSTVDKLRSDGKFDRTQTFSDGSSQTIEGMTQQQIAQMDQKMAEDAKGPIDKLMGQLGGMFSGKYAPLILAAVAFLAGPILSGVSSMTPGMAGTGMGILGSIASTIGPLVGIGALIYGAVQLFGGSSGSSSGPSQVTPDAPQRQPERGVDTPERTRGNTVTPEAAREVSGDSALTSAIARARGGNDVYAPDKPAKTPEVAVGAGRDNEGRSKTS